MIGGKMNDKNSIFICDTSSYGGYIDIEYKLRYNKEVGAFSIVQLRDDDLWWRITPEFAYSARRELASLVAVMNLEA